MDEMITHSQAEILFAALAAALLIAGISAAATARPALEARIGRRGLILLIAAGPLLFGLWLLDGVLIAKLGFATLLRLGVELGLFVALGLGLGLWLRGERAAR